MSNWNWKSLFRATDLDKDGKRRCELIAGEEVVAVASGEWDDMARSGVETV